MIKKYSAKGNPLLPLKEVPLSKSREINLNHQLILTSLKGY